MQGLKPYFILSEIFVKGCSSSCCSSISRKSGSNFYPKGRCQRHTKGGHSNYCEEGSNFHQKWGSVDELSTFGGGEGGDDFVV